MPASAFANTNFRKAFAGSILHTLDDGTNGLVYEFPVDAFEFNSDDGNSYPGLIDGSVLIANKIRGIKSGPIRQSGPLRVDRGVAAHFGSSFGPRTNGKLTPWYATISEYEGAAAYAAAGLWFQRFQITGQFGMRGQDSAIRYMLDAMLLDPDNTKGLPASLASAAVGGTGTAGAGISTFGSVVFDNNNATVYDGIRSFGLSYDNQMTVDPSVGDNVNLLAAGMTPGQPAGSLTLTQLKGAVNPLPQINGEYPIRVRIPTGDGTHTMTVVLTASYTSKNQRMSPTDYTTRSVVYRTLGAAPGFPGVAMGFSYV